MPMPLWWGQINKRVFNPLSLRGDRYQVIRHVGRSSGRAYRTPLEAVPVDGSASPRNLLPDSAPSVYSRVRISPDSERVIIHWDPVTGISHDPGTRATSMSSSRTPWRSLPVLRPSFSRPTFGRSS